MTCVKSVGLKAMRTLNSGEFQTERFFVFGDERREPFRGPLRLEPDVDAVRVAEVEHRLTVGFGRFLKNAENERRAAVAAHGHFDLGHALADRERGDEFAHRGEHVGNLLRKNPALRHVGDVRGALFVEAHENAALFRHVAHRQTRAVTVVPSRPVDRRKNAFGTHLADVPERVEENLFLIGDLSERVEVLHGAAAAAPGAVTEIRAGGLDALHALAVHRRHATHFVARLVADALVGHAFAGQRAHDEDDLAVPLRHAATFLVEALHVHGEVFRGFPPSIDVP